jgi:hypothetical protein
MKRKLTVFLFSFSLITFLLYSSDLSAQFYSLRTKNLRLIYYSKAHEYVVPHVARSFENSLRFHRALFNYSPTEDVAVFLHDFNDYGNGGTTTVPKNRMSISMEPFDYVYETMPANERMNWLMNHELVHVVATDKASRADNLFRSLFFGKVSPTAENPLSMVYSYLSSPRWYSPRWYHEGIAVFLETWMAGGLGRVLGAYDEMVFRTMVRDSAYFYDIVGLESEGTTIDFQVGQNSYLYGTRFVSYLAFRYGPEKLLKWFNRTSDSKRYFSRQFKKVYGIPLDKAWSQWIEWEHRWQKENLESIRTNPTTQFRTISNRALGSVSRAFYDSTNNMLYTALLYPGQTARIAAIDIHSGEINKISEVRGPALYYVASLAYDSSRGQIFFTTDNMQWRDLKMVDVRTGKSRTLIKDARTGDLAFNPADKSLWGVRHYNGISTIVRIPPPYNEWNYVYSWPYGKDFYDLDISPDGSTLIGALVEASGKQKLIKIEIEKLLSGNTSYDIIFDFEEYSPANFIFSPDGRYLFGSSYYSGVSNIYRYDVEKQEMEILTNCETGFFRPVPISNDSLVVFRYTGEGFIPVMIANQPVENVSAITFLGNEIAKKYPIVRSWKLLSPTSINLDSLQTNSGDYRPLGNLSLTSVYPIVEGYKDYAAFGVRLNFADRLGITDLNISASYTPHRGLPQNERPHLRVKYRYGLWRIAATYNGADFYDLFGPTKVSRKGYSLALQYRGSLLREGPRSLGYTLRAAGYGGLERLPDFQNIQASFDKLLTMSAVLDYKDVRASLGAVDQEKGLRWQLTSSSNYVRSKFYPRVYSNFDYGFLLPISHSPIWLRSSAGYSFGDREEPFANFYFGGFGNNWVDYLQIKRYREQYSFPGVELNAIGGTNYARLMIEWVLPPIRFRRFGFPSFYLRWARLSFFSSGIATNLDSKPYRRGVLNVGGQIDFRLVTFSLLRSTFSLGYGAAFERGRPISKEFMFSLKIL